MTPTPPQPPPIIGAPPREQIPIAPVPCEYRIEEWGQAPDGEKAYRLTFHTPDTSLTTFWTQTALHRLGLHCQEKAEGKPAQPQIQPADLADLRALRDAAPFEDT